MFTRLNNSFSHLRIQARIAGSINRKLQVMHKDEVEQGPFEDKTNYSSNFQVRQWTQVISYDFTLILLEIQRIIQYVATLGEYTHQTVSLKMGKDGGNYSTTCSSIYLDLTNCRHMVKRA